jgi:hypothetical protein
MPYLPLQDEDASQQKKSGLSPTHFSVFLRCALKAKPWDKFVCFLRLRRFPLNFNGSAGFLL